MAESGLKLGDRIAISIHKIRDAKISTEIDNLFETCTISGKHAILDLDSIHDSTIKNRIKEHFGITEDGLHVVRYRPRYKEQLEKPVKGILSEHLDYVYTRRVNDLYQQCIDKIMSILESETYQDTYILCADIDYSMLVQLQTLLEAERIHTKIEVDCKVDTRNAAGEKCRSVRWNLRLLV